MGHLSSHTKSEKYAKCREGNRYGLRVTVHIKGWVLWRTAVLVFKVADGQKDADHMPLATS